MNDHQYLDHLIKNEHASMQLVGQNGHQINRIIDSNMKQMPKFLNDKLKQSGMNVSGGTDGIWADNGIFDRDNSLNFNVNYDTGTETLACTINIAVRSEYVGKSYRINLNSIPVKLKNPYQIECLKKLIKHLNTAHQTHVKYYRDAHSHQELRCTPENSITVGKLTFNDPKTRSQVAEKAFQAIADEIKVMVLAWIATIRMI